jgi:type IV secretion system protein TrbL
MTATLHPVHERVLAIDLNPLHWLGSAASAAVGDVWKAAMTGLWSAALWLLQLAFKIIDAFTTPDLTARGPMGSVLPTTLWIGATVAVLMMFVQLTVALVRRDGQSLGRVLLGVAQFGLVWVGYLGVAAGLVAAAAGLEKGILQQMLHIDTLSGVDLSASWPTKIGDVTLATVLGVLSILIVIPAAFFYVLIMFVREAALIILVATAPISAAGLVSDTGRVWFWKTLRWFFSCLLISPCVALLLGIGVKLSEGVISPPAPPTGGNIKDLGTYATQMDTAHAGMAVVGCIVIAIGAVCPLILFRLLAFVEPGTASGAALRQSWAETGGLSGVLGASGGGGASAATAAGVDGRSQGESTAESQTQSRLAAAFGAVGSGVQTATSLAQRAADLGTDILGQAGVGSPGYSLGPADQRALRRPAPSGGGPAGSPDDPGGGSGDAPAPPTPPGPPDPPPPPSPSSPPLPGGGAPGGVAAGGGAGAGGAEAGAAAVAL